MKFKANIYVTLKKGVLDPQGKAVRTALASIGHFGVESLRIGKFMEVEIEAESRESAEIALREISEGLLANTVIEDYRFELKGGNSE